MDDIILTILTSNDAAFVNHFISKLQTTFDMTDLGSLKYFLVREIDHPGNYLLIKYGCDLLVRFGLADAKLCLTLDAIKGPSSSILVQCSLADAHYIDRWRCPSVPYILSTKHLFCCE